MPAPQTVLTLVENFERNLDAYRSGKYNETQVRRDFIDPLFKALGWDMDNSAGYAEAYRDVIHEDAIKIGASTKAPDYSFRVGGQRKFFLEAKKPSVNVKDDIEPAFQLRRYAWSAKLPLSIVCDFEEFAIYDCCQKPDKGDKASKARLFYCTFRDYADKWDEIAAIFSKEAVLKGSFDKYAGSSKGKRGTSEVDGAFLEEIEGWRDLLARNIALRNSALAGAPPGRDSRAASADSGQARHAPTESPRGLSQRELNFAVQQTIDRIIFLRICEDRGIEPYGRLMALQSGVNVYGRLREMFRDADDRYNSGLFHFKREKGRAEAPDELTLNLEIDDKPLKEIFKNLYYPDCPYEFSVLGADILGSVYEQFLGKVIRLTAGNRAVVEDKPEVKKAGGVFYTPAYIVQYIVEHTVSKLLEGKTPKQVKGMSVLDPACGSGSFLIGAYQYLLDWYLARYVEEGAEKHSKGKEARLRPFAQKEWRLTTSEKKRILLEHIYGVDIDAQAVEVTKLSLLLKMLEGESDQTLTSQMKLFHERVLPDLDRNIQCGNSLIGPDFYDGQLDLDAETAQRINVFDWQAAFPQVFNSGVGARPARESISGRESRAGRAPTRTHSPSGGFDAVIGNPPYVRVQLLAHHEIDYLFSVYKSASSKIDLSVFFLEKSLNLISKNGLVGLITTKQWISTDYGLGIRKILSGGLLKQILDFGSLPVFVGADTYPAILICQRIIEKVFTYGLVQNREDLNIQRLNCTTTKPIPFSQLGADSWNLSGFDLVGICKSRGVAIGRLADFGHVYIGDLTGMDEAFVVKKESYSGQLLKSDMLFPYAYRGAEVSRYSQTIPQSLVIYPYKEGESGKPILIDEEDFQKLAPKPYEYLLAHKAKLRQRMDSRRLYATEDWYRHLRPGNFAYIRPKKLIFKGIDTRLSVGLLGENCIFNGANTPAFIPESLGRISLHYILGILNSRLIGFYLVRICPPKLGGYTRFNASNINETPIRTINVSDKADLATHDKIVAFVEKMLALHQQLTAAKTPQDTNLLQRQIDATDKQIDQLVYALYGLTDEEIALVEGSA